MRVLKDPSIVFFLCLWIHQRTSSHAEASTQGLLWGQKSVVQPLGTFMEQLKHAQLHPA
jgi:hypothetical protein